MSILQATRTNSNSKEIRCGHCNKLLGKGTAHNLSIKCTRCGCMNHVRDMIPKAEPCDAHKACSCKNNCA